MRSFGRLLTSSAGARPSLRSSGLGLGSAWSHQEASSCSKPCRRPLKQRGSRRHRHGLMAFGESRNLPSSSNSALSSCCSGPCRKSTWVRPSSDHVHASSITPPIPAPTALHVFRIQDTGLVYLPLRIPCTIPPTGPVISYADIFLGPILAQIMLGPPAAREGVANSSMLACDPARGAQCRGFVCESGESDAPLCFSPSNGLGTLPH